MASIKTSFDTSIFIEEEVEPDYREEKEIKVCVSVDYSEGSSDYFSTRDMCWYPGDSDEVEITEIYNYETEQNMDISKLPESVMEKLYEQASQEAQEELWDRQHGGGDW